MGDFVLIVGALFLGIDDLNLLCLVHLSPAFHITDAISLRTPGLPFSLSKCR